MKIVLIFLAACVAIALSAEADDSQAETRHFAFYGGYRPQRRPSRYYYYYHPQIYQPPPVKTSYYLESCCADPTLTAAGCSVYPTRFGITICKCCIRDQAIAAQVSVIGNACSMSSASAATTVAPAAAAVTTTAATATTAAATTTAPTTTTSTVATTTAQTRFCPNSGCTRRRRAAYNFLKMLRIEGGTQVSNVCDYPGVVAIEATAPTGQTITVCTGALMSATTIQVPSNCADTLALVGASAATAIVDGQKIPISSTTTDKPLSIATLSTPVDIAVAPTLACIYDKSMGTYDKSSCEIIGYGVDAALNNQAIPKAAGVTFDALACNGVDTSLTVAGASYGCAKLDNAAACAGDGGALITCNLDATGEKVVVGQAETFDCDTSTPAVYFQNFDV